MSSPHPLSDLTVAEIKTARDAVQNSHPRMALRFKAITLEEPEKTTMLKYLEAEHAGRQPDKTEIPARVAFCVYYIKGTTKLFSTWVNVITRKITRSDEMPCDFHGCVDGVEVAQAEKLAMSDPAVLKAIEKLKLPANRVVVPEAWGYGADSVNTDRLYQVYMFVGEKGKPDFNHYAFPTGFSAIYDPVSEKILRVENIPTGEDDTPKDVQPFDQSIPDNEYVPEAVALRTGLKPLHVLQPEGPSFSISSDRVMNWQKWSFRIGFNYREGVVLRDIRYDEKPLFYRISLSEMCVPYGDPRAPFYRKMAFDLGDVGAGMVANNLSLGCDCLGSIAYLDGTLADANGYAFTKKNAVCIHEQDDGIGWKHSNYRTERACVTRNRQLVIQTILTVSNYEYILAYIFNQAGELEYHVRATGILSTSAIDQGKAVDYGVIIHPGVLAAHHQHILSLRIDPALGSYASQNRVAYVEAHPMPLDDKNPAGNGYKTVEQIVEKAGGHDLNSSVNRTFLIQNDKMRNPVNNMPIAYKIHSPPTQPLVAHPSSVHYKRAEFADHAIYVTKYREDELFSGGKFTNQSRGGTGIRSWTARGDSVVDDDIAVWVQFGINHIPRIEDFPVM